LIEVTRPRTFIIAFILFQLRWAFSAGIRKLILMVKTMFTIW
jgi:hypothetical protein